jgi:hypothetical protein
VRPKEPVVVGQRPVGGPPGALCSRGLHSGIIHRQPAGSDEEFRVRDCQVLRAWMLNKTRFESGQRKQVRLWRIRGPRRRARTDPEVVLVTMRGNLDLDRRADYPRSRRRMELERKGLLLHRAGPPSFFTPGFSFVLPLRVSGDSTKSFVLFRSLEKSAEKRYTVYRSERRKFRFG